MSDNPTYSQCHHEFDPKGLEELNVAAGGAEKAFEAEDQEKERLSEEMERAIRMIAENPESETAEDFLDEPEDSEEYRSTDDGANFRSASSSSGDELSRGNKILFDLSDSSSRSKTAKGAVEALLKKLELHGVINSFTVSGKIFEITPPQPHEDKPSDSFKVAHKTTPPIKTKPQKPSPPKSKIKAVSKPKSGDSTDAGFKTPLAVTPPASTSRAPPKKATGSTTRRHASFKYQDVYGGTQIFDTAKTCPDCDPTTRSDRKTWFYHYKRVHKNPISKLLLL